MPQTTLSPVVLPEITTVIAEHLEHGCLVTCVQVCKSWYRVFAPHLYEHVRFPLTRYGKAPEKTPWEGLQKFSSQVRTISVSAPEFPSLESWGPECRHLTTLYLGPFHIIPQQSLWFSGLMALVEINPNIHTLQLVLSGNIADTILCKHKLLRNLPGLKNLLLVKDSRQRSCRWSQAAFQEIMAIGPQLDQLVYNLKWDQDKWTSEKIPKAIEWQMWTGLTSLNVYAQKNCGGVELVERCPNLKHLSLKAIETNEHACAILNVILQHCRSGYPTRLEHLEISKSLGYQETIQPVLLELFRACAASSALKSFCYGDFSMSDESLGVLMDCHGKTLEEVGLTGLSGCRPTQMHTVLSRCHNLRIFKCVIDVGMRWDCLEESSWACPNLRILHIESGKRQAFDGSGLYPNRTSMSLQREFWKNIGKLKSLRLLHLNIRSLAYKALSISYGGAKHLAGLEDLMELVIPSDKDFMGQRDKEYLLQRRPFLRINYL
ncbi:hypothetical protein BGZ65_008763 [Modicella reniformis]|uniref:F-box domain-containing protein n=1 Tax=Modicella reniformis TaxID=1440133 RepID=A0A9P6LTP7_9FUNG|nr:hypothetical protein BGZ65_008763 [Modicella reniformis]